ncbi:outer membrane beta-barrel protein [Methylocystis sp. MJC1]|jgi:outer membrane immunogenic protein|uniref:outer membrane protein n=1 Tax=Methylocystis sp. MJC1 TaxID=2654282 RepID=UPI0013EB70C2|nr:outer membrane beta-barrel protein [Methylocystis sp. MJC1]KAF2992274.1 hypothetical protein MJC1_00652 [Methylocystis sp. MJC1]MBU6527414.1 porin family protein [Methylocystis sp. MJC1]UZX10364.1 outer membrane beta-barrel protein [Methylocystis sp. MJC1]
MKKIALSVAALALTAGSALSADLPSRKAPPVLPPPPPPAPLWTGFYVGLNAGGTWANNTIVYTGSGRMFDAVAGGYGSSSAFLGSFPAQVNSSGFIGGGQVGYNWQFYNSFVAGIEADIQGIAGSRNTATVASAVFNPVIGGNAAQIATVNRSLDYIGTVRGRLGWLATPTLLVYGTGGLAYGGVTASTGILQTFTPPAGAAPSISSAGAFSDTRVGWTAGGGVEWMFWPNWSAKVEYLYYDLGNVSYALSPLTNANPGLNFWSVSQSRTRFNGNIVRAGLNYHFNWGAPAPVVAKY